MSILLRLRFHNAVSWRNYIYISLDFGLIIDKALRTVQNNKKEKKDLRLSYFSVYFYPFPLLSMGKKLVRVDNLENPKSSQFGKSEGL